MFQRLLVALAILILSLVPVAAQNNDTPTYRSEDGAVQFSYADEWTLETHQVTFNALYQFALLTPEYNPFQNPAVRSRIFIELINSETNDYARNFETAADFATYALEDSFGITLELEDVEINGHSAVRSAFLPFSSGEHTGRLYAILRDDGWAVVASVSTPITPREYDHNDFEHGETSLLSILESLEFDATAAATPFERNLEVYNTDEVTLDTHYVSEDGIFSVDYPADWEIGDDGMLNTLVSNIAYIIPFTVPDADVEMSIMVFKVGDEFFNQPLDENSPEEYMHSRRNMEEGEVREFRIGDYDAVSVVTEGYEESTYSQEIAYIIADQWIAMATTTAPSTDLLAQYEPSVVAILSSIHFAVGAAYIDFPYIYVTLPEPWEVVEASTDSERNIFQLQSSDEASTDMFIYLVKLDALGLAETADDGLQALLSAISPLPLETDIITIDEYEVLRSDVTSLPSGQFAAVSLILVNAEWLFFATAQADTQEAVVETLEAVDTIIADMEITLPEN